MAHGITLKLRELNAELALLNIVKITPSYAWPRSEKRELRRKLERKFNISSGRQWVKLRKRLRGSGLLSV